MTGKQLVTAAPRRLIGELESASEVAGALWRLVMLDRDARVPGELVARGEALVASGALDGLARRLERAREPADNDEILEGLAVLLACFPKHEESDTRAFAAALAHDVANLEPSRFALDLAMTRLRHSQRSLPPIAVVLTAIENAELLAIAWANQLADLPKLLDQTKLRAAKGRPPSKAMAAKVTGLVKRSVRRMPE